MDNYETLKQAVLKKQCVSFMYKGCLRKVTVRVIGKKNNVKQGLFHQYGGQSNSGLSSDQNQNWRCIPVDEIRSLLIIPEKFVTIVRHKSSQSCIDVIDVEVMY